MMVPKGTPTRNATVLPIVRIDNARPCVPGEARLAATAEATGVNTAAPKAATTLARSNIGKEGANAATVLASANNTSAPTINRFLAILLVAETSNGDATAKVTANIVTKSPAVATDTERSSAISTSTPATTYAPVPTAKDPIVRVRMRKKPMALALSYIPLAGHVLTEILLVYSMKEPQNGSRN